MSETVAVPPIVSWEEAKAHLRLDSDEEQAYVEDLVRAAEQWIARIDVQWTAEVVPQPIKQAVLLLVGQWYSYRANVAEDGRPAELPMAVEALLSPYRSFA